MFAEKFILRADGEGRLTGLPIFAANEEIEILILRKEPPTMSLVPAPYHLEPVAMGLPSADIDLTKALRLADELEDEALAGKL